MELQGRQSGAAFRKTQGFRIWVQRILNPFLDNNIRLPHILILCKEEAVVIRRRIWILLLGILWVNLIISLETLIRERSLASGLSAYSCMEPGFREQRLTGDLYRSLTETDGDWVGLLTASMLDQNFAPSRISQNREIYLRYKEKAFFLLEESYRAVWADVKYFPVASEEIFFENTWMAPREYGGERLHEGTDLFGKEKEPGYYPIVSMTDGTVEQKGWLPLGGNRIGVRSPEGGYFYYAHLASYEKDFRKGDRINAGDILGYMGNTGYGEEGTAGKFPVHLHLGIYIETPFQKEMSVNPYWLLKIFEKKTRNYVY